MIDRRFDDLTKLTAAISRRQVIGALTGSIAGGLLTLPGTRHGVALASQADHHRPRTYAPGTPGTAEALTVVAAGLTNPRGFAFAPDGSLIVTIAGQPGPNAGVARIEDGCPSLIAEGLPAYRIAFGGVTGVADVAYLGDQLYALVSGGDIDGGSQPNGLYRLDGTGGVEL
ncbi:MAG TPA: hypothetical protein VGR08_07735, partial [Thermomicrobiales bacterium]|nr:hypothetical protein [Thermomicrobiales bacterium]